MAGEDLSAIISILVDDQATGPLLSIPGKVEEIVGRVNVSLEKLGREDQFAKVAGQAQGATLSLNELGYAALAARDQLDIARAAVAELNSLGVTPKVENLAEAKAFSQELERQLVLRRELDATSRRTSFVTGFAEQNLQLTSAQISAATGISAEEVERVRQAEGGLNSDLQRQAELLERIASLNREPLAAFTTVRPGQEPQIDRAAAVQESARLQAEAISTRVAVAEGAFTDPKEAKAALAEANLQTLQASEITKGLGLAKADVTVASQQETAAEEHLREVRALAVGETVKLQDANLRLEASTLRLAEAARLGDPQRTIAALREEIKARENLTAATKAQAKAVEETAAASAGGGAAGGGGFFGGVRSGLVGKDPLSPEGIGKQLGEVAKYIYLYEAFIKVSEGIKKAIELTKEYETSLITLQAALVSVGQQGAVTGTQLSGIGAQAGLSPGESVTAGTRGIQAFRSEATSPSTTNDVSTASLEAASQGAVLSGQKVNEVQNQIIATTKGFELGFEGQTRVLDAATNASNSFGASIKDVLDGISQVAGVAKESGFSVEQLANALSLITSTTGLTGASAAGDLKRILGGAGAPAFQKALADTGVDTNQSTEKELESLGQKYDNLSAAQRENVITTLGGRRSAEALIPLLAGIGQYQAANQVSLDNAGAGATRYAQLQDTLAGTLRKVGGETKALLVDFGQSGLGAGFGLALQSLVPLLRVLDEAVKVFDSISPPIRNSTFAILELVGAVRILQNVGIGGVGRGIVKAATFGKLGGAAEAEAGATGGVAGAAPIEAAAATVATGIETGGAAIAAAMAAAAAEIGAAGGVAAAAEIAAGAPIGVAGATAAAEIGVGGAAAAAALEVAAGEIALAGASAASIPGLGAVGQIGGAALGGEAVVGGEAAVVGAGGALGGLAATAGIAAGAFVVLGAAISAMKAQDLSKELDRARKTLTDVGGGNADSQTLVTNAASLGAEAARLREGARGITGTIGDFLTGDKSGAQANQLTELAKFLTSQAAAQTERQSAASGLGDGTFGPGGPQSVQALDAKVKELTASGDSASQIVGILNRAIGELAVGAGAASQNVGKLTVGRGGGTGFAADIVDTLNNTVSERRPGQAVSRSGVRTPDQDVQTVITLPDSERRDLQERIQGYLNSLNKGGPNAILDSSNLKHIADLYANKIDKDFALTPAGRKDALDQFLALLNSRATGTQETATNSRSILDAAFIALIPQQAQSVSNASARGANNTELLKLQQSNAAQLEAAGRAFQKTGNPIPAEDQQKSAEANKAAFDAFATRAQELQKVALTLAGNDNKQKAAIDRQTANILRVAEGVDPALLPTAFTTLGGAQNQVTNAALATAVNVRNAAAAALAAARADANALLAEATALEAEAAAASSLIGREDGIRAALTGGAGTDRSLAAQRLAQGAATAAQLRAPQVSDASFVPNIDQMAANGQNQADKAAKQAAAASAKVDTPQEIAAARAAADAFPGAAVEQAAAAVGVAAATLSEQTKRDVAYYNALKALRQAQYAYQQTLLEAAKISREVGEDLTNPLTVARENLRTAQAKANSDRAQGAPSEVRNSDLLAVRAAQNALEQTKFQQGLDQVTTNKDLERITQAQYVSYLDSQRDHLQRIAKRTFQQQQELNQIDKLLKEAANQLQGQFNLGDIKLPTVFEVRRSIAGAGTSNNYQSTVNNVQISGVDFAKVVAYLQSALGSSATSRYATSTRKGS